MIAGLSFTVIVPPHGQQPCHTGKQNKVWGKMSAGQNDLFVPHHFLIFFSDLSPPPFFACAVEAASGLASSKKALGFPSFYRCRQYVRLTSEKVVFWSCIPPPPHYLTPYHRTLLTRNLSKNGSMKRKLKAKPEQWNRSFLKTYGKKAAH